MQKSPLAVLLAFAVLAGCGGYRGIREPQLTPYNSRWERRLTRQARTDLACRAVRLVPLSESVIQVDGCNQVAEYGLFCLGSRDCTWRPFESVASHAMRDLACPNTAVSVSAPSPLIRAASGCGRSATYALACTQQHCAWTASAVSAPVVPIEVVAVSSTGAPTTDGAVIPPPPGSTPPPVTSGASTDAVVIPPPPGATPPPATSGASTDDVVIPPPPPS